MSNINITNEELSLLIKHSTGYRRMELVRAMVKRMDVPCIFNNDVMDNEVHRLVVEHLDMFLEDWCPDDYENFGYAAALESVLDILFDCSLLTIPNGSLDRIMLSIPDCFKASI
jgi:glutaredoxin